jgi:hypothetical protein
MMGCPMINHYVAKPSQACLCPEALCSLEQLVFALRPLQTDGNKAAAQAAPETVGAYACHAVWSQCTGENSHLIVDISTALDTCQLSARQSLNTRLLSGAAPHPPACHLLLQ